MEEDWEGKENITHPWSLSRLAAKPGTDNTSLNPTALRYLLEAIRDTAIQAHGQRPIGAVMSHPTALIQLPEARKQHIEANNVVIVCLKESSFL